MLNEEVIARNKYKLLRKPQLIALLIRRKLQLHVIGLRYDANVVIIEDGSMSYTIKHKHYDCIDHYLIPISCRGDFYIRKWINDTIIIRKRKNVVYINQVSTFINLLWSLF